MCSLLCNKIMMPGAVPYVQHLAEFILRRCTIIRSLKDFRPSQEETALCDISDMCRFVIAIISPSHMVDNDYLSAFLKAVDLQRSGAVCSEVLMMVDVLSAVKASPEFNPWLRPRRLA